MLGEHIMIYTICPRGKSGLFSQKYILDCDYEFARSAARHSFTDNGVHYVEIYEGKVPVMDCWGKPVLFVYRDGESKERVH